MRHGRARLSDSCAKEALTRHEHCTVRADCWGRRRDAADSAALVAAACRRRPRRSPRKRRPEPPPSRRRGDRRAGRASTSAPSSNLLSDYRFRGVSRSDEDPAVQAAINLAHSKRPLCRRSRHDAGGHRQLPPARPGLPAISATSQLDLYAGYGAQLGGGFELDARRCSITSSPAATARPTMSSLMPRSPI